MVQLTASSVDIILTLVFAAGSPLNCRNTTGYLLSYCSFPSNLPQSSFFNFFYRCFNYHNTITTVLRPFFRDHAGEPMPEENFWTLWCKGRLTEADKLTIWLGATPSRPTSAHLHHPPHIFWQARCPSCGPTNSIKATIKGALPRTVCTGLYISSPPDNFPDNSTLLPECTPFTKYTFNSLNYPGILSKWLPCITQILSKLLNNSWVL